MLRRRILFGISILLTLSVVPVFAQSTWNVPAGGDIQAAINSASAGDTIQLAAGTYVQQVRIYKNNIRLVGVGNSSVIQSPAVLTWSFTYSYTYKPIVAVDNATGVVIENLYVDGNGQGGANYRFCGIGFWQSGGTVRNVSVAHVRDNPFGGNQHGYGIISRNSTGGPYSLLIENCNTSDIQKNGIHIADNGVTATIRNCTVSGNGANAINASNGIVVSGHSHVDTISNHISGYHWTGGTWSSEGIIYMSGASGSISSNALSAVQGGIYVMDAGPVTVESNTINLTSNPAGIYFSAIAFGEYYSGGTFNGTISNNNITGNGYSGSMGFDVFTNTGTVNISGSGNDITNFDTGISIVEGTAGAITSFAINNSNITGNVTYGASSNTAVAVDLRNNWWGSCDGPSGAGPGSGDAVTTNILFDPPTCMGNAPVAVLSAKPNAGFLPSLKVMLDGSASYDSDGTVVQWNWNLGDGSTASGPSLEHIYYGVGKRSIHLTVTDNNGMRGNATERIAIFDPAEIHADTSLNHYPLVLRARGVETATLTVSLSDILGENLSEYQFEVVFSPNSGQMVGNVSYSSENGLYTQILKSGSYGPDSIQIFIGGILFTSIPVMYEWPLPPVNISVKDIIDRSLFRGEYFKQITWSHNPEQYYKITKYRIYRSTDGSSWSVAGETDGNKTEYLDGGFKNNPAYQYKITAIDTENYESDLSN